MESGAQIESQASIRLDKWLWAARFFKTRSMAAQAIEGGKVNLNGVRTKPGRLVRVGDELAVRRGPYEWTVIVRAIARLRGPANEAERLYEETEESRKKREDLAAQLRLERTPERDEPGRPSKKARREMLRFKRRG